MSSNQNQFSDLVLTKLRDLEVANIRLRKEKLSLQRQLEHILKRLADGRMMGVKSNLSLEEYLAKQRRSKVDADNGGSINVPLARMEYPGITDSVNDSNFHLSNAYSSLSDTYEEYCLQKDYSAEIRISGLSNISQTLPQQQSILLRRNRRDSFGDDELNIMQSNKVLGVLQLPTQLDTSAISADTVIDMVASSSSATAKNQHKDKFSQSGSVLSDASSRFYGRESQSTEMAMSYSSSTEMLTTGDLRKHSTGDIDLKKAARTPRFSVSLPSSLQLVDDQMKSLDSPYLHDRKSRREFTDSLSNIIKTSSPRKAPPTVKITRKQITPKIQQDLLTMSSNVSSDSLQKHPRYMSSIRGYNKPVRAHSSLVRDQNISRNVFKAQPLYQVGDDSNFLNNFQPINCFCSSDLSDYVNYNDFVSSPGGFIDLIKYLEIYTVIKFEPCLVQRMANHKCFIDFQTNYLIKSCGDMNNFAVEQSKQDSSSETMSGFFNYQNYEDYSRKASNASSDKGNGGKRNGEEISGASLEYYTPPYEEDNNNSAHSKLNNGTVNSSSMDSERVLYSGYISKLGNKFKMWHRYWCQLTPIGLILYNTRYKSDHHPTKCILLCDIRNILRPQIASTNSTLDLSYVCPESSKKSSKQNPSLSVPIKRRLDNGESYYPIIHSNKHLGRVKELQFFEIQLTSGKLYTLRSDNSKETEVWLIQLKRALKRAQAEYIVDKNSSQLLVQGWLKRIKSGHSKKIWCQLIGNYLIYYKSPVHSNPTGFRPLLGSKLKLPSKNLSSNIQNITHHLSPDSSTYDYNGCTSESESDTAVQPTPDKDRTFSLWVMNRDPVYFVCSTNSDFEKWKQYLLRACSVEISIPSPQFAKNILFSSGTLPVWQSYWRRLVRVKYIDAYYHTRQPLSEPLSRTTDIRMKNLWRGLFEYLLAISYPSRQIVDTLGNACNLPTRHYTPRDARYKSAKISQKYSLLHTIVLTCFQNPCLKDELYLQLIKQCTPPMLHQKLQPSFNTCSSLPKRKGMNMLFCTRRRSSGNESSLTSFKQNIRHASPDEVLSSRAENWTPFIAQWECLCLLITVFLPSPLVTNCLELFLQKFNRQATTDGSPHESVKISSKQWLNSSPILSKTYSSNVLLTELSKYAAFCSEMLQKSKRFGGRHMPPSALEVAAISIRNPYTHSLPFSLPIHFPRPQFYEVISFDGTTKVFQLINRITVQLQLEDMVKENLCMIGLYCKLPRREQLIYLSGDMNVCDVISSFEQTIARHKLDNDSTSIELCFRIQCFSQKLLLKSYIDKCRRLLPLLVGQMHAEIQSGFYCTPLRGIDLLELIAIKLQIDQGDYHEIKSYNMFDLDSLIRINDLCDMFRLETSASSIALNDFKAAVVNRWNLETKSLQNIEENLRKPFAARSYLAYLQRISQHRFSAKLFACKVRNNSRLAANKVYWIAPCFDHINFLEINKDGCKPMSPLHSISTKVLPSVELVKSIPIVNIISYGAQPPGLFFIVYKSSYLKSDFESSGRSNYISTASHNITSPTPANLQHSPSVAAKLQKIQMILSETCAILELTQTLTFIIKSYKDIHKL